MMATKKILDSNTLQTLLQLVAIEIKKKADYEHAHANYVTTATFNNTIAKLNGFSAQVVTSLPTTNIDTHTIYLKPKTSTDYDNAYEEWMYINNKWEKIGSTEISLDGYVKTEDLPTKLSELENDMKVQTKSEVDTAIAEAVTGGTIDFSGYTTDDELREGLATKADKAHTHKISDVESLQTTLNNKADKAHVHEISDITGLQSTLNTKINTSDLEYLTTSEIESLWKTAMNNN